MLYQPLNVYAATTCTTEVNILSIGINNIYFQIVDSDGTTRYVRPDTIIYNGHEVYNVYYNLPETLPTGKTPLNYMVFKK